MSHLELEEGDFRHRDVEGEGFVPARVEPIVLDRLRCRLWIPREILVVTSDNHLGKCELWNAYRTSINSVKILSYLDIGIDNIMVNIKLCASTAGKVLPRDYLGGFCPVQFKCC